jgi:hypothetical protein
LPRIIFRGRPGGAARIMGEPVPGTGQVWAISRAPDVGRAKPIFPNRSGRKQRFSFNKRLYKLRCRVENAFSRLKDLRRI